MKKNLVVTMSGGTTSVINATLAGVITAARENSFFDRIYSGCPGLLGVLNENLVDLTDLPKDDLALLTVTPASGFVGTTRFKPISEIENERLSDVFNAHNIGYLVNIGGNGTIKQSRSIADYFDGSLKVVALPKTVDNDLGDNDFRKVFYTPGFPSCANYWMHKAIIMNQENLGAHSHDKVYIAQTFGRETGFIAGCARLADKERRMPLILLLPEDQKPLDVVLQKIESFLQKHNRSVVIMAEGYDVGGIGARLDPSGQVMYGSSMELPAQLLVNACVENGMQARAFIPGPDQRSDIIYTLREDTERAFEVGYFAVENLLSIDEPFFASISKDNSGIYNSIIELKKINNFSRKMSDQWIDYDNFDVTDKYISYLESLTENRDMTIQYGGSEVKFAKSCFVNINKKLPPFEHKNAVFSFL